VVLRQDGFLSATGERKFWEMSYKLQNLNHLVFMQSKFS
jgi:hypothetical protein